VPGRPTILQHAGVKNPKWTDINSVEMYRARLEELRKAANASSYAPISLAEWELTTFN
jgi:hypothetical protein